MKNKIIELSNYNSVDFLWTDIIEKFGLDKAKQIISQAINVQRMQGKKKNTMPIVFTGTGGSALISIESIKKEKSSIDFDETNVLIFNLKEKSFQLLKEI